MTNSTKTLRDIEDLRNHFAASAMAVLLSKIEQYPDERWREGLAEEAYRIADAMLEQARKV